MKVEPTFASAAYGRLLVRIGRCFMSFILNEKPDEEWAKFALAEAMEELRCGESKADRPRGGAHPTRSGDRKAVNLERKLYSFCAVE
jgi:hypothetical protein